MRIARLLVLLHEAQEVEVLPHELLLHAGPERLFQIRRGHDGPELLVVVLQLGWHLVVHLLVGEVTGDPHLIQRQPQSGDTAALIDAA